jgi:hypothetical protein
MEALEDRCVPTGTIQGTLFEDVNGNGTRDAGEPGLAQAGVTVYLDLNGDRTYQAGEPTALTDAGGNYTFTGLSPGTYAVGQLAPAGFMQTGPAPNPGPGLLGDIANEFAAPASSPRGLAWVGGALFVNSDADIRIYQLDPATGSVVGSFAAPVVQMGNITHDGTYFWGADWGTDNFLTQFDASGAVVRRLASPVASPFGLAWDGQDLWVSNFSTSSTSTVYRINPSTGAVLQSLPAPETRVTGLAFDGTHLWCLGRDSGLAYELDPATGAVLRSFIPPGPQEPDNGRSSTNTAATFDGQYLWTAQNSNERLYRVDVSRPGLQTVAVTDGQTATADFGDFRLGSVSGRVFNDLNHNGVSDAGEPGLAGWLVYLDGNGNGRYDAWERSAITDANGNYTLDGLRAGTFTLAESLRTPGWFRTAPAGGTYRVTITTSGQAVYGRDFADYPIGLVPVGPETLVNVTTAGTQQTSSNDALNYALNNINAVASDGQGSYVVAWAGNGSGDADGVFARLYGPNGRPRTGELLVNTTDTGVQADPVVAMSGNGSFVVAWRSAGGIYAQRYDDAGVAQGTEFAVFSPTSRISSAALGIGMDGSGNFAVLYATWFSGGPTYYVQRYSAAGVARGRPILVVGTGLINIGASLAMSSTGTFVVTWSDAGNDIDVFAQRYSSAGQAIGSRITVASTSDTERSPSVAMDADGNFVVAWEFHGSAHGRAAQIFNADGTPRGRSFVYSDNGGGSGNRMPVAFDSSGIVFAYGSDIGVNISARRYTTDGAPVGADFMVNTTLAGLQQFPSVALTGGGTFVVTWDGSGLGDDAGVFLQRYGNAGPLVTPDSVSGRVYNDLNHNGEPDAGEPGLVGWVVYLDGNGNGRYDAGELSAITDTGGNYTIGELPPGTYTVAESLRAPGWVQTAPAGGTYTATITARGESVTGLDFGDYQGGIGPVGSEARANVTTAGTQQTTTGDNIKAAAGNRQGNYVVTWQGNGPGDPDGIFARLYGSDGRPRTDEFRVNETVAGAQAEPMVAMSGNGTFVITWSSAGGVFARRYSATGIPQGDPFVVAAVGTFSAAWSVGIDGQGNFAILFATGAPTFYVQRYSAAGVALGGAIRVATPTLTGAQATLAMSTAGTFVVTWDDAGNAADVFAQRYDNAGNPVGSRLTVASGAADESAPSVAMAGSGNFVVAWLDAGLGGRAAQVFNADGTPRGSPFLYTTSGRGSGQRGAVAFDSILGSGPNGAVTFYSGIVFAYTNGEIFARRYTVAGAPIGGEFVVNSTLDGAHYSPSAALNGSGFVIAWNGNGPGDDSGVFFQRYGPPTSYRMQGTVGQAPSTARPSTVAPQQPLQPVAAGAIPSQGAGGSAPAALTTLQPVATDPAPAGMPQALRSGPLALPGKPVVRRVALSVPADWTSGVADLPIAALPESLLDALASGRRRD